MNPLRDDPNPSGIRVAHVEITLPGGFTRIGPAANPDAAIPASVKMTEPALLAFVKLTIEDGAGIGYTFTNLRLLRGPNGWSLTMPTDPKRPTCTHDHGGRPCGGRNVPLANYCNWCGGPLAPVRDPIYHEVVRCVNAPSASLLLSAVLAAYRIEHAGRMRPAVWRAGDPLPGDRSREPATASTS